MLTLALLQSIYFTLAFGGPALILGYYAGVSPAIALLMMAAASSLGLFPAAFFSSRRLVLGLLGAAVCLAAGVFVFGLSAAGIALTLLLAVCQLIGVRTSFSQGPRVLRSYIVTVGFVLYFICSVVVFFARIPLAWALGVSCFCFVGMTVFLVNYALVSDHAGSQAKIMRGGNRVLSLAFLGVVALLAFFKQLKELVAQGAIKLISLLFRSGPPASAGQAQSGGGGMDLSLLMPEDAAETPHWLKMIFDALTVVMTVVALAAAIALVSFLLYRLFRGIFRAVREYFQGFDVQNDGGFVQETEQLLSVSGMGRQLRKDMGKRIRRLFARPVPWERLSPNERVRRLYEGMLRRLFGYDKGALCMTPEQLANKGEFPEGFALLYNTARYSPHEVSFEDAENYKKRFKVRQ